MPRGIYARTRRSVRIPLEPYRAEKVEAPIPTLGERSRPTSDAVDTLISMKSGDCVDMNRRRATVKGYVVEVRKLDQEAKFVVRDSPDREGFTRVWRLP